MVRAKFKVTHKVLDQQFWGPDKPLEEKVTIHMSPVSPKQEYVDGKWVQDVNDPNLVWWQYSPTGKFELGTVNKAAADQLELGKEYYIDLTLAE